MQQYIISIIPHCAAALLFCSLFMGRGTGQEAAAQTHNPQLPARLTSICVAATADTVLDRGLLLASRLGAPTKEAATLPNWWVAAGEALWRWGMREGDTQ